ncbi:hypothetical protein U14_04292 [Candidatus Moduliflexus flocculans]|uniref:Uncharacterized protein n=1 Tax=Candidatus Moduliflexus flocculans TaxID=1499966 RepID=A0A0S6W3X8_9BACT|nr:hypothetical protein U14_04292 [Candidatus Moduliflexus flocculans]
MNVTTKFVCFVIAAICFFVKGAGLHTGQFDLMNIGFGFITVGMLV